MTHMRRPGDDPSEPLVVLGRLGFDIGKQAAVASSIKEVLASLRRKRQDPLLNLGAVFGPEHEMQNGTQQQLLVRMKLQALEVHAIMEKLHANTGPCT